MTGAGVMILSSNYPATQRALPHVMAEMLGFRVKLVLHVFEGDAFGFGDVLVCGRAVEVVDGVFFAAVDEEF